MLIIQATKPNYYLRLVSGTITQPTNATPAMKTNIFLTLLFFSAFVHAQSIVITHQDGNYFTFEPDTAGSNLKPSPLAKKLNQQPYFTYFWNFGDGTYCTEPNPEHVFRAAGNYTVILELTGIKSDPDDDVVRLVSTVVVADLPPYKNELYNNTKYSPASTCNPDLQQLNSMPDIELNYNREPIINEPITYLISYDVNGTNDVTFIFPAGQYNYVGYQTFYGETVNLANLNFGSIAFTPNMAYTGVRNILVTLQPKATALGKTTTCSLSMSGFTLLSSQTTTKSTGKSYDPNIKWVRNENNPNWQPEDEICLSWLTGIEDTVYYRIEFENLGDGPVKNIEIRDFISANYFNINSVHVTNSQVGKFTISPTLSINAGTSQVRFNFTNLQNHPSLAAWGGLPGSSMNGIGTAFKKDNTWGFVEFYLKIGTYPPTCQDITNSAAVYFDNNLPEITPPATVTRNPQLLVCSPVTDCETCRLTTSGDVSINSGSCATLTAYPHTFGPDTTLQSVSYVWYPGGQTTQSISVCPTYSTYYKAEARYSLLVSGQSVTCIGRQTVGVAVNPCAVPPSPVSVIALSPVQVCAPGAVLLSASGIPTGYTYRWYVNGIRLWQEEGSTMLATYSGQYTVVAWGSCPQTSAPIEVTVHQTCPCISAGRTTSGEWIQKVTLNGAVKLSGNNGGYINYSAPFTTLYRGHYHPLELMPLFLGGAKDEHWAVFIDLNQNLIYEPEEELFTANSTATITGQLGVPFWATTGACRMRISMQRNTPPQPCDDIIYGEVEDYIVQIADLPYQTAPIQVRLEGPWNPIVGVMDNNLSLSGLLPEKQPFNTAPWNYNGLESAPDIDSLQAVDWLLIEALNPSDFSVAARSAVLLLQNGTVVNMLGSSGALFYNLTAGQSYHLAVRARNHLPVLSAGAFTLPPPMPVNLTLPANIMGSNQLKQIPPGGIYALYSGDINADGVISVADFNLYQSEVSIINQYLSADVNMDRAVTVLDFNYLQPNLSVIGMPQVRY